MADQVTIRFRDDGPILIDGPVQLTDGDGQPLPIPETGKGNIALCRCGASASKPFCDGAHRRAEFCSVIRAE